MRKGSKIRIILAGLNDVGCTFQEIQEDPYFKIAREHAEAALGFGLEPIEQSALLEGLSAADAILDFHKTPIPDVSLPVWHLPLQHLPDSSDLDSLEGAFIGLGEKVLFDPSRAAEQRGWRNEIEKMA